MLEAILSFVLYALYVLLPIIPAAIIFKKFPHTKVGVSGPLSRLSINATGAFGAYIITVLLGFFLVSETQQIISDLPRRTWTVVSPIELYDENSELIENRAARELAGDFLKVKRDPKQFRVAEGKVYVRTEVDPADIGPTLRYTLECFHEHVKLIGSESVVRRDRSEYTMYTTPVRLYYKRQPEGGAGSDGGCDTRTGL